MKPGGKSLQAGDGPSCGVNSRGCTAGSSSGSGSAPCDCLHLRARQHMSADVPSDGSGVGPASGTASPRQSTGCWGIGHARPGGRGPPSQELGAAEGSLGPECSGASRWVLGAGPTFWPALLPCTPRLPCSRSSEEASAGGSDPGLSYLGGGQAAGTECSGFEAAPSRGSSPRRLLESLSWKFRPESDSTHSL